MRVKDGTRKYKKKRGREGDGVCERLRERQCISKRKQGQRVLVNIIIIQIMIFDDTITLQMVS